MTRTNTRSHWAVAARRLLALTFLYSAHPTSGSVNGIDIIQLQGQLMVLTYLLLVPLSGYGLKIKNPITGRDLSCDESRRPPRGPLRGRSGPPALCSDPGRGL